MKSQYPRVVYWNHSPTPYFVERFNAVADRGTIDFEAWFNERREPSRSWDVDESSWRFRARYIPSRRLFGWDARVPIPELRAVRPELLVQEYDRSHLAAGFLAARAVCDRTAFRVLPNFDSWSDRRWWREAGKHAVFKAVDGAKVPGPDGRRLAERYGLDSSRIHEVTQTIDVDAFGRACRVPEPRRARGRAELGLGGCVFVYVGRLWTGKGLDDLLAAYRTITGAARDVSLLLVGDGPDEARYRSAASALPRVAFAGFVQARDLPEIYALADALVFPTLGDPNGLVIEEAMAAGLPVIATMAAGDVRNRVPDGEAGFLVQPNSPAQLAEAMCKLADSEELRRRLSAAAVRRVARYAHQQYAVDFERFVEAVLAAPRRRGLVAGAASAAGTALVRAAGEAPAAPVLEPDASAIAGVRPAGPGEATAVHHRDRG